MHHLLPCSGCDRHVRASEPTCPFCGEALPMSLRQRAPRLPGRRLGRAATFAFGAAVAASTATGCGDGTTPGDDDAGTQIDAGTGEMDASAGDDAGTDRDDAGSETDAGPDGDDAGSGDAGSGAEDAGNVVPPYGTPPEDGGGITPLYGGPTPIDGGTVTPRDGGGITPLYGGSPA